MPSDPYPIIIFIAFCAASSVFIHHARSTNRSWSDIGWVLFLVIPSAWFGAKIAHTLFEAAGHPYEDGGVTESVADLLSADPWHWARIFEPGFVFYGGLIAALFSCFFLCVVRKIENPWQLADCGAPALALGLAIGRLGCFFAGCCYGRVLPGFETPIPVPLIESLFALSWFCTASLRGRSLWQSRISGLQRCARNDGSLLKSFLFSYAIFRFAIEFVRGDEDRGMWLYGLLSTSQIISIVVIVALGSWAKKSFRQTSA